MGFVETLGIRYVEETPDVVEGVLTMRDELLTPHGVLHGGATIALLETVASRGAQLRSDTDIELPFGVTVEVRHHKSGRSGDISGTATFVSEEPCRGGVKQYWDVVAYDEEGDIVSGGTVMTKTLSRAYLDSRTERA